MDEWGIPDWLDPKAYGDTSNWTIMRWRWEFYRRRDDLREAFGANAERTYSHFQDRRPPPWLIEGDAGHPGYTAWVMFISKYKPGYPNRLDGRVLRSEEPGFVAFCDWEDSLKFGYIAIPNPRISDQPEKAINAVLDYPVNSMRLYLGRGKPWPAESELEVDVRFGEAAVVFDLTRPIGPQVKAANRFLQNTQKEEMGRVIQRRIQKGKLLGYLRALDARAALTNEGVFSWNMLADALYHAGLLDRHKDPAGGYGAPPHTAARDKWQQADALRNNFGLCFTISD